MPTHYSQSARTGDEGIDFIRLTCTRSNALFLERPRQDIGIDGHIELLNQSGEPTGAIAFIQAKAGSSYISHTGNYQIKADRAHFETWSKYTNPVIGIVYNPSAQNAYWVSITEYLQSHPKNIQTGPYVIEAPLQQPFSQQQFAQLQTYIETQHAKLGKLSPQKLIDQYFSADAVAKIDCLTQLFSMYRWTSLICFFLHQVLRIEEEQSVLGQLIFLISFYRDYIDRPYYEFNSMPKDNPALKSLAQKCIAGYGRSEVIKMLSTIDENGLERGSIGNLIETQLEHIPGIENILREIAENRALESELRGYSVLILAGFLGYSDANFYHSLLENANDMFYIETLHWALEWGIDEPLDNDE